MPLGQVIYRWPGYVGVLSGNAPGRFAATINLAFPLSPPLIRGWPPSHLLRHILDNCVGFNDALETLHGTPVCFPTFVMLVGVKPGQAAVVEMTPNENRIHLIRSREPIAIANDYLSGDWREQFDLVGSTVKPHEKDDSDEDRRNVMLRELNRRRPNTLERAMAILECEPVANESTMQRMVLVPKTGECLVVGVEDEEPVAIGRVTPGSKD